MDAKRQLLPLLHSSTDLAGRLHFQGQGKRKQVAEVGAELEPEFLLNSNQEHSEL